MAIPRVYILAVLILLAGAGWVSADENTYAKGDKVRVKYAGEVVNGKVVATKISGFIEVEYEYRGSKNTRSFPLSAVVESDEAPPSPMPEKPATPTTTPKTGSTTPKPKTGSPPSKPTVTKPGGAAAKTAENEVRTWTDSTGKFKIEASFASIEDGKVKLTKPDGTQTQIPLDKLSDEDRALAEKLATAAEENPFAETDQPTMTTKPAKTTKPQATTDKFEGSTQPVELQDVDWSGVPELERFPKDGPAPANFTLEPDAISDPPREFLDRPYIFAKSQLTRNSKLHLKGFFEHPEQLMMDPSRNQAIIVMNDSPPGKPVRINLIKINLKDGKQTEKPFPASLKVQSYHPESQRYLACANFFLHPKVDKWEMFGVWSESEKALTPDGAWLATRAGAFDSAPNTIQFAGDQHAVLTTFPWNTVTVWDIQRGRPLYRYQMDHGLVRVAVSSNGKYLAYIDPEKLIRVVDVPTGNLLGRLPIKNMDSLAFDNSGRYLATCSGMRVTIYDFQEGKISKDFFLCRSAGSISQSAGLQWVGDGYLLTATGCLIDIEHSTILWRYGLPNPVGWAGDTVEPTYSGGRYWYVQQSQDGSEMGLFGIQIPHPEALDAAAKIDPEAKILKPGVSVRLALNISTNNEQISAIRNSLTKQLEAAGMSVSDQSDLTLTATNTTGQQVSGTYHFSSFGRGGPVGDQTVTTTPQITTLTLARGNTVYWKSESVVGGFIPPMILLKEGQGAQEYINELSKPDFGFFERVELPTTLMEPAPKGAYGFSDLTTQGLLPGQPPTNW